MKTWFSPEQRTSYRQGLGIVMLILSIFLLLSFGSSIHQFANDHSIVTSSNPDFSEVENLMGGVGAKLSHYFIEMRFGIGGAFALALAIGLVGLNFVRDSIVVSYYKIFKELLFFMTFSMVTSGVFRGHLMEVSYPIDNITS